MRVRGRAGTIGAAVVLVVLTAGVPSAAQDHQTESPEAPPAGERDEPPAGERDEYCAGLPEAKRRQTPRCQTEEERRADEYQRIVKEREAREKPEHTSFLRWVHVDGLWLPGSVGAGTYGLVGVHLVVANIKRVHFFGPPGVMLLTQEADGRRRLQPALSWGLSIYLSDFQVPGSRRTAQLHLNLAKCWTMGTYQNGLDMFGLSVTWKK